METMAPPDHEVLMLTQKYPPLSRRRPALNSLMMTILQHLRSQEMQGNIGCLLQKAPRTELITAGRTETMLTCCTWLKR